MKRTVLSVFAATLLVSANEDIRLEPIEVEQKIVKKTVQNLSQEQIKSADLAEALYKNIPSASLVRRSGIANDIIIRGAKKDNINVLVDNAKIYGACPNRMDPPTSHVLSNNIESVEVLEGPYDVENFGTLSGSVKVNTKKPSENFQGEVNLNAGSFAYKKGSFLVSGGNDKVKVLLSASKEKSDPYKDGDGNNFLEQQENNGTLNGNKYSKDDLEAYEKQTVLVKTIFNLSDDAQFEVSYNANRSENILYPNTPMDADYDDSDIYTAKFTQKNLGEYSKELNLEYYYSKVEHPMSTRLRNNAVMSKNKTNNMESSIWGAKLTNSMDLLGGTFDLGYDTSVRNWDGFMSDDTGFLFDTISSTDTKNNAIFTKYEKNYGSFDIDIGARYDDTSIETETLNAKNRDFNALSAYAFTTFKASEDLKYFAGIGKASRVPDARELYYDNLGNENLEQTTNYQVDLGFEKMYESGVFKAKTFVSNLDDYIYHNGNSYVNIDARVYGLELSGLHLLNDHFNLDYSLAYLRGKKDEPLEGKSDRDLAEIPPLKANVSLNYEEGKNKFSTQVIAADAWDNYDSDAKEQRLSGYAVMNLKYDRTVNKNFAVTFGVDNVFDTTYTTSNTYQDINLITSGLGDRTLLNEPGRYVYVNFKYTF